MKLKVYSRPNETWALIDAEDVSSQIIFVARKHIFWGINFAPVKFREEGNGCTERVNLKPEGNKSNFMAHSTLWEINSRRWRRQVIHSLSQFVFPRLRPTWLTCKQGLLAIEMGLKSEKWWSLCVRAWRNPEQPLNIIENESVKAKCAFKVTDDFSLYGHKKLPKQP